MDTEWGTLQGGTLRDRLSETPKEWGLSAVSFKGGLYVTTPNKQAQKKDPKVLVVGWCIEGRLKVCR